MGESAFKFANKLELRYVFNDKSNYMDAMIRHRCEKEVLALLRTLADMLDVRMTIYNEPFDREGGFRERLAIAGENSHAISIVISLAMRVLARPSLIVGGRPVFERSPRDEEDLQRELAALRRDLRLKAPGATPSLRLFELLEMSPRFLRMKSNFYEALRGYPKVSKVVLRELNERDRPRSGALEVKRERFDYYILRSGDLPTVKDGKATIEIISPVLKDSKYRWKGIYNKGGEIIDFYMQDEEFKAQMFDEKISFASGMCIDCVLEIARRLSELGEVVNVSYTVTTVIRTRFDKMEIVTPQGKRHLRKLEAEKKQLTLDFFS